MKADEAKRQRLWFSKRMKDQQMKSRAHRTRQALHHSWSCHKPKTYSPPISGCFMLWLGEHFLFEKSYNLLPSMLVPVSMSVDLTANK